MSGILLDNVDADETSEEKTFGGGTKVIVVRADDFGGGEVNIQQRVSNDSLARFATIATFTSNGQKILESVKSGIFTRAVLTGSTSPINVFAALI